MSVPRIDLSNRRYGRWTVKSYAFNRNNRSFWNCVCDCGNEGIVRGEHLRIGKSRSCGCYHKDKVTTKGGRTNHSLYNIWKNIVERCTNHASTNYPDYGGRGITLCSDWLDFEKFAFDIYLTVGHRPSLSHTLDRIDNNLGYDSSNVRWATWKEQAVNRRRVKSLESYSTEELIGELRKRKYYEYTRSKSKEVDKSDQSS